MPAPDPNLDHDPGFVLLVVFVLVPLIVALEVLIAFDELRGAAWTKPRRPTDQR